MGGLIKSRQADRKIGGEMFNKVALLVIVGLVLCLFVTCMRLVNVAKTKGEKPISFLRKKSVIIILILLAAILAAAYEYLFVECLVIYLSVVITSLSAIIICIENLRKQIIGK